MSKYPDTAKLKDSLLRGDFSSDDVGITIMEICSYVCNQPNWSGYSMIDEWEADCVVACVKALPKIDLTRTTDPGAYLSRTCQNTLINLKNRTKITNTFELIKSEDVTGSDSSLQDHLKLQSINEDFVRINKLSDLRKITHDNVGILNKDGIIYRVTLLEIE